MSLHNAITKAFTWQSPAHGDILARERGQMLVRIIVSALAGLIYYIYALTENPAAVIPIWGICLTYATIAIVFLCFLLYTNTSPAWRRYTTNVADMIGLSFVMIIAKEAGMPVFLLYLWITLGNGFRFGVPALIVSAVLSILGFSMVIAFTEVWQSNLVFAAGVLLALVIIPFQAARGILQHQRHWAAESNRTSK